MTRRRKAAVAGGLVVAAGAALAVTDLAAARLGLGLVACLLLPGLGWARKMRFGDRGDTLALAVVLSMCATVAVGTTMAVANAWSLGWGLATLGVLTAAGFVPATALADRARAAVQRRITDFGDDGGAWAEWHARNEQQALRRREQAEAAAIAATQAWGDWYAGVAERAAAEQSRDNAATEELSASG